jgi:hypothetical protein
MSGDTMKKAMRDEAHPWRDGIERYGIHAATLVSQIACAGRRLPLRITEIDLLDEDDHFQYGPNGAPKARSLDRRTSGAFRAGKLVDIWNRRHDSDATKDWDSRR